MTAGASPPPPPTGGPPGLFGRLVSSQVQRIRRELADPLLRNGYALILNIGVTSITGILYWILAAQIYDARDVGTGSAAISILGLLSSIAILNFGGALARYAPRAGTGTKRLVLIAYGSSTAAGAVVTVVYVLLSRLHVGVPVILGSSLIPAIALGLSVLAWNIFTLEDGVLTGLRAAVWAPLENGGYGLVKIVLLVALAPVSKKFGIFASWVIPAAVITAPINLLIFRRLIPRHSAETAARAEPVGRRELGRFVAGDYVGSLFSKSILYILPVLVLVRLGAKANAYFFVAFTITTTLDLITTMLGNVLTVEGAHDPDRLRHLTRSVLQRVAAILLPSVLVILVAARLILSIYGADYSHHAATVLRFLALATLLRSSTTLHNALARVHRRVGEIAITNGAICILCGVLSMVFAGFWGINGVAIGYLIGQALVAAAVTPGNVRLIRGLDQGPVEEEPVLPWDAEVR